MSLLNSNFGLINLCFVRTAMSVLFCIVSFSMVILTNVVSSYTAGSLFYKRFDFFNVTIKESFFLLAVLTGCSRVLATI